MLQGAASFLLFQNTDNSVDTSIAALNFYSVAQIANKPYYKPHFALDSQKRCLFQQQCAIHHEEAGFRFLPETSGPGAAFTFWDAAAALPLVAGSGSALDGGGEVAEAKLLARAW
jgi:hypothetical protein